MVRGEDHPSGSFFPSGMKRKIYIPLILFVLLLLAAAIGTGVYFAANAASPSSGPAAAIRTLIGLPAPPEAVAEQWMNACRDGDGAEIFDLLSARAKDRFCNRAALSNPGKKTAEVLARTAGSLKRSLNGAVFEFEKQKSEPGNNSRISILVRVLRENGMCREFPLTLIQEPSGHWKCDVRI